MKTYHCIIVDDEPPAHTVLKNYISRMRFLTLDASFYTSFDALEFLNQNHIDIMFLDIQLNDLSGLDMLSALTSPPSVILTTAYSSFALDAFNLGVVDYLLKPIQFERFAKAINKITEIHKAKDTSEDKFIFIKTGGYFQKVFLSELIYIEGFGNFVKLHFQDKFFLTSETMQNMLKILSGNMFIRIHKSFVINKNMIIRIHGNMVTLTRGEIPIGPAYKEDLLKALKI